MTRKEKAEVLLSFFEYRAIYREPLFEAWHQSGLLVQALYRVFQKWELKLENITTKENPGNLGEVQVVFSLFNGNVMFVLGIGSAALVVNNPNWSQEDLIVTIANAALVTLRDAGKVQIGRQSVTLAMHLKPESCPAADLVSKFVHPDTNQFLTTTPKAFGFSVYGDESSCVVDLSASDPEALFVRIERSSDGASPLEKIAVELRGDEERVLGLLGLDIE